MKKGRLSSVILILIFLVGLSLLLYPTVSEWWNSFHSSKAISNYEEVVDSLKEEEYERFLKEAQEYNQSFIKHQLNDEEYVKYESILNVGGNGIMGYIEIPLIDVSLPIYHGTAESVLQVAVGHLEWTSLPVGGKGTHCVLSGHRGLPSAKLFSNLDKLANGDIFILNVLNEKLTYEVDQILIVNPDEVEALDVIKSEDYCTLVTCTPYGINTHRLLVRGHRIETVENIKINVSADATAIDPLIMAPIVAAPMLFVLLIFLLVKYRKKKS